MSKPKTFQHPICLYFHTHWDREWYEPFVSYQHKLLRTVDGVLSLLEQNQLPCFTLDGQTALLEDYLAFRPESEARIATLVKNQRLSVGPWFVMPDEFLVSGESLIRNLQRGISESKLLGQKSFTGYLPDTFGHSADIPMILYGCGICSAVIWRGVNPKESLFLWQSPSGQTVNTLHLTEGYFNNILHMAKSFDEATTEITPFIEKIILKTAQNTPAIVPVGADHLGLNQQVIDWSKQLFPKASVTTIDQFMTEQAPVESENTEIINGELTDCSGQYILPGVYSSRLYLKQKNRQLEWQLSRQLEPLLLFMNALGINYPYVKELDWCWKTLLLNHPHDSICGCSVDSVHRENEARFEQLEQKINALYLDASLLLYKQCVQGNTDIAVISTASQNYSGVALVTTRRPLETESIFAGTKHCQILHSENVLDWRCALLETELPLAHNLVVKEDILVWLDNIEPNSVTRISSKSISESPDSVEVTEKTLENNNLKLSVDFDGTWTITDKQQNKTYTKQHQLMRRRDNGDSYNAAPIPNESPELAKLFKSKILAHGPLRGIIELTYQFPNSQLLLQIKITLDAGSSRLDIETRFTNTLENHIVQTLFSSELPVTEVMAEGHFNWVKRQYDPHYKIENAMPATKFQELKTNTGPIQRTITWQNQALITKGLTEYEVRDNTVALTLLRAFGTISKADTGVRGSHAGPPLATPEGQCLNREIICHYAWLPVSESAVSALETMLSHQADLFYGALQTTHFQSDILAKPDYLNTLTSKPVASSIFFNLNNTHLLLTALQPLENNQYLLRVMNPGNTPQELAPSGLLIDKATVYPANYLGESPLEKSEVLTWPQIIAPKTLACFKINTKD